MKHPEPLWNGLDAVEPHTPHSPIQRVDLEEQVIQPNERVGGFEQFYIETGPLAPNQREYALRAVKAIIQKDHYRELREIGNAKRPSSARPSASCKIEGESNEWR